jgi:hypothetical protein
MVLAASADAQAIRVDETADAIVIETDSLHATVRKRGYVSGVAGGTLVDKKTGAKDLGHGLHIMDFLLAPGWGKDDYVRDPMLHGNLAKHYVEGPQICTKAKEVGSETQRGKDFVAVTLRFQFHTAGEGLKTGSKWKQTLLFHQGWRYFLGSEEIESVNDVDDLFYRIDMPGHIHHKAGDSFEQVYLSYEGMIPASDFTKNFPPDGRHLYQRKDDALPARMIRAYQIKVDGRPGPWLAGMSLDPGAICEAWCHQRGYVCMIAEVHRRHVKAGEKFGAAHLVGFFDDVAQMERTYDQYKGATGLEIEGDSFRTTRRSASAQP